MDWKATTSGKTKTCIQSLTVLIQSNTSHKRGKWLRHERVIHADAFRPSYGKSQTNHLQILCAQNSDIFQSDVFGWCTEFIEAWAILCVCVHMSVSMLCLCWIGPKYELYERVCAESMVDFGELHWTSQSRKVRHSAFVQKCLDCLRHAI